MCFEVETLGSVVLSVQRDTREQCDSISGSVTNTNFSHTWRRAGPWVSTFPEVPNWLVQIPGSPGSSQMQLCCLLTATHCSAVSAGLELRSTHSGKAEMQPGSAAAWGPQGWYLQSPGSALQPPEPPPHYLLSAPPFPPDRALKWTKTLANLLQEGVELWAGRWNKSPKLVTAAGGPWSWPGVFCQCQAEVDKPGSFFPYLWGPSPCFLWLQSPAGIFEAWEGTPIHSVCCTSPRVGFTSHLCSPRNNIAAFGEQGWGFSTSVCLYVLFINEESEKICLKTCRL